MKTFKKNKNMNYKKIFFLAAILLNLNLILCMLENNRNESKEEKKIFNLGNLTILPDDIKKEILNYIYEDFYVDDKNYLNRDFQIDEIKALNENILIHALKLSGKNVPKEWATKFKINNLLFEENIKALELKTISKDFNRFINKYYKEMLKKILKQMNVKLIDACCFNQIDVLKLVIKYGADINIQGTDNSSALHYGSKAGNPEIVKLLIDLKIKTNNKDTLKKYLDLQDCFGDTALIIASREQHEDIVELLINFEANPSIKNNRGQTALSSTYNEKIKEMLESFK